MFLHYTPATIIKNFIASFTYYKDYHPEYSVARFLPNGNTEIVISLDDSPKYIYDNDSLAKIQSFKKIWISGIRTGFISIPSGGESEMFIIEFKKGMVYPFLQIPLTTITDTVIEGDLLLKKVFFELREELLNQPSPSDMFMLAEKKLLQEFHSHLTVNPVINFALSNIIYNPQQVTLKNIYTKTGYSNKHLIKLFADYVGLTPKPFLKLIRFQKAIHEIEVKQKINWAAVAYECGYYDQSHFIEDFKKFSGFTPLEYSNRKGVHLNYVPVG